MPERRTRAAVRSHHAAAARKRAAGSTEGATAGTVADAPPSTDDSGRGYRDA